MIEVRHLTKRYGAHLAVDDLSFTVESGKIYGLLGPNGAGKSTTMNIITGCLAASEGEVIVNGHDIFEEPVAAKKCVGYLPEIPPVYTDMTVSEYLRFIAEAKDVPAKERKAQLEEILESIGLADVRGRLINNLSKGYRQRVGIAQALVGNPEIVILDEPTVGLDPKQIIEIRDLIRMLGQKHTVILSSHILSEVSAVCDSVMIIAHGRLVANGTPEELTRLFAGDQEIHMELKGNEDAVRGALGALENAAAADIASENGVTRATLRPENGADIREAVFRACAKANLPILEMHTERASLEEIFLELTQGDGQEGAAQPPEEQNETPAEGGETA